MFAKQRASPGFLGEPEAGVKAVMPRAKGQVVGFGGGIPAMSHIYKKYAGMKDL